MIVKLFPDNPMYLISTYRIHYQFRAIRYWIQDLSRSSITTYRQGDGIDKLLYKLGWERFPQITQIIAEDIFCENLREKDFTTARRSVCAPGR